MFGDFLYVKTQGIPKLLKTEKGALVCVVPYSKLHSRRDGRLPSETKTANEGPGEKPDPS